MAIHTDLGQGLHIIDSGYNFPQHTAIYVIVDNGKVAIFDAAHTASAKRVVDTLKDLELKLEDVELLIISHSHLDHSGGAGALIKHLPNAKVFAHSKTAKHLIDPSTLIAGARTIYTDKFDDLYGEIYPIASDRFVTDINSWQLGNRTLEFFESPGHTFDHICVLDKTGDFVLAGDTFGVFTPKNFGVSKVVMRVPAAPTQFSPKDWQDSTKKIVGKNTSRICLTHFGEVSENLEEKAKELCDEIDFFVEIVTKAKQENLGREFFAQETLKYWKERLGITDDSSDTFYLNTDLLLTSKGLDHWMNTHFDKFQG